MILCCFNRFAESQGYRSLLKISRSFRRRGGPGRAPRLQRRSFRVPSSSDRMTAQSPQHPSCGQVGGAASDGVVIAEGSCKERTSSFREDSLVKIGKLNFQKSLTSPSRHVNVTTSEPSIDSDFTSALNNTVQSSKGAALCPSIVTTALPSPFPKTSKSVSPIPHNTSSNTSGNISSSNPALQSRSPSRLPRSNSPSPLRKSRNVEYSSAIVENENGGVETTTVIVTSDKSSFEEPSRSQSALAASTMHPHHHHQRANSETMSPAMSSQTIKNEASRHLSKSVNELSTVPTVLVGAPPSQLLSLGGSVGEFESADEESTSDTSMRYLYDAHAQQHVHQHHHHHHHSGRFSSRREVEMESDTSKDCTNKVSSGNEACSVDNDELSQVSERQGFLLLKKKKGSRRKDRYSKSSLIKRASANFSERGIFGGTEKLKEEVVKFFKRKKSIDDNESCSSSTKNASVGSKKWPKTAKSSPYREAKFFFRRRRLTNPHKTNPGSSSSNSNNTNQPVGIGGRSKSSGNLFRSNSDSHSLGQTSLDSMPSVGSEPVLDPEDEYSSHEINTGATVQPLGGPTLPQQKIPEVDEGSASRELPLSAVLTSGLVRSEGYSSLPVSLGSTSPANVMKVSRNKIIEMIEELGYSADSPLKLYISSMDALLVYDPSDEVTPACDRGAAAFCACSARTTSSASPDATLCRAASKCSCGNCCHICASSCAKAGGCVQASAPPKVTNPCIALQETSSSSSLTMIPARNFGPSGVDSRRDSGTCRSSGISHLFESDTSFSTVGSFRRIGTTESSFSSANNTPFIHGVDHFTCCDYSAVQSRQGIALPSHYEDPLSNFSDEEILVVDTSYLKTTKDDNDEGQGGSSWRNNENHEVNKEISTDEQNLKFHTLDHSATDERILGANPGCTARSPIPEEMPTAHTSMCQSNNTTLTGANNVGISAAAGTNSSYQHGPPAPSSSMSSTPGNTTASNNMITNSSNTSQMSAPSTSSQRGAVGGVPTGDTATHLANANNTKVIARDHESGAAAPASALVANLDESAVKDCLESSQSCPPHPSDPPQSQHSANNGHSSHHQHHQSHHHHRMLHHQPACQTSFSREASSLDTGESADADDGLQFTAQPMEKSGKVVTFPKTLAYSGHHYHGQRAVPTSSASYASNHVCVTQASNMSGMGTTPMLVGGVLHRRSSESDLSTPPKRKTLAMLYEFFR